MQTSLVFSSSSLFPSCDGLDQGPPSPHGEAWTPGTPELVCRCRWVFEEVMEVKQGHECGFYSNVTGVPIERQLGDDTAICTPWRGLGRDQPGCTWIWDEQGWERITVLSEPPGLVLCQGHSRCQDDVARVCSNSVGGSGLNVAQGF